MDDGTGARSRGRTGPGASARVAGRRRARHLVRPGARRAVAGPVAGVGHAVVGTRGAHQQPVGPLVETARMRALPFGGGDAARHRPGAPPVARRPSRRADRRRHHARAPDESRTRDRGARSAAVSRAHGPGLLRECAQEGASRRGAPPAAVVRTARRSPAPPHHRVRSAPGAPGPARAVHRARHPSGSGSPQPGGPRAREVPPCGVRRRAATARAGRDLAGARPGHSFARHDRRSSHGTAGAGRAARRRLVGAFASGARPHALRRGGAQRPARRGGRRAPAQPRHGAARPRPLLAGVGGIRGVSAVIHGGDLAILLFFLVLNSFYALLLVLSIPEIWEQTRLAEDEDFQRLMQSSAVPPITILVPAHNESATIEASVTAILTLEYRNFEVVVVNDGSKDDTLERLRHAFDLYEVPRTYPETLSTYPVHAVYRSRTRTRLLVIDKENAGKADSLNAAVNASRFPLVIAVDADTLIEPDALLRLTRPFLLGRQIAAVGGTVRVANGCTVKDGRVTDARVPRRSLPGIQVVEYLRAFLFGRLGWNRLGGSLVISGAFGLFRKEYLHAIGGYQTRSVVEDMDLVIRLHRYLRQKKIKYEISFIPDPLAWTEVPESGRILGRQRERWHRGLIAAMWEDKTMLFKPRYGRVGLLAVPFFTLGEMLAPLVELLGYVATTVGLAYGIINVSFALLFLLVAWGYGMLLSLWAVGLEEASFRRYRRVGDLSLLLLYATLETFGYRQRTVWWRLQAFGTVWRGRQGWGGKGREGVAAPR